MAIKKGEMALRNQVFLSLVLITINLIFITIRDF